MSNRVPNGWQLLPLGKLGKFTTSSVDKLVYPFERPVKLVNYMDAYTHHVLDTELRYMEVTASEVECARSQVHLGDILFTPSSETPDDIGHSAVVAEDMPDTLHSYHTVRLRPSGDYPLDINFSAWFANASEVRSEFSRKCAGSTRYTLTIGAFKKTQVLIPPLAEQTKIGEVLSLVQANIEKTESLIAKYQKIKAGLMHDLFTRGVTSDGKLRPPREHAPELYQESPIGWIPKEWGCKKLGVILLETGGYLQTGPFGSQLHAHEYTHEGVPVVMPQDIEDGKILEREISRIPEVRAQFLARHRVKFGDIIIARRGELSRAAAITHNEPGWVCGTGCFLLRLAGSELDSQFFSYAYRHHIVQRQIEGMAVGTTMPSLNNSVMSALYFPYVRKVEQAQITERLEIAELELRTLLAEKEKLGKQKAGLMCDLLTGKVRARIREQENTI